jgi:hypothetical protein
MNADAPYLSSLSGGHCLSTLALRQYIDGTLPKNSLHQVEKHLLDCEFCSNILEDMDVGNEAIPAVQNIASHVNQCITQMVGELPKAGFWTRYRYYISGGIGALVVGAGLLVYNFNAGEVAITHTVKLTPSPADQSSPPPATPPQPQPDLSVPNAQDAASNSVINKPDAGYKKEEVQTKPVSDLETHSASSGADHDVASKGNSGDQSLDMSHTASGSASPDPENTAPSSSSGVTSPASPPPPVNYANLQISGVKVITKMTKSEGSSRGSGKNGQLNVSKNRGGADFLPEEMPEYPGGEQAMQEYIEQNFKNPVKDKRTLSGTAVGVMFTVSSRGRISDVEVTKSIGKDLDVEIIRLISSMPQWNPAKHKGDITCVLALTVK